MFSKALAGSLAEDQGVTLKLVHLVRIHPALRLEFKGVLAPIFSVCMDTPGAHSNSCVLWEEFTTDGAATSGDGTRKRETGGRVETEGFLDDSSEKGDILEILPGRVGSVQGEKGIHKLLVDITVAAQVDDDVAESDGCSIRSSQARKGDVSTQAYKESSDKRYSHKNVGVVGNFSQWESVAILVTCFHKTLEQILATSRVPFSDTLLDLADHAPGVVLHSSLLDNFKLGEGPDPRKVRPGKLLE